MNALSVFNIIAGIGTIYLIIKIASVLVMEFLGETNFGLYRWFKNHVELFAFLLVILATLGSLTYSNYFKFAPCEFCWWIRIMLYPQVVIFAIEKWRKSSNAWLVSTILSIIGLGLSIYLILLQAGKVGNDAACVMSGVSCAKIDVTIFGWITIPIMVLVVFVGMLTLSFVHYRKEKN